ncbi:MAG: CDGSH iron-sulfur domain-containing protein [Candidatus Omnitrophica bacterium]|nr:CDGSH iron-sulfur domain-containing protein [Candidatus Omnitrophota bacterium]
MEKPIIFAKEPIVLELEAGTYYWCSCGQSKTQPFCDRSHAGSSFRPEMLVLPQKKRVVLCQCKHTEKKPFCDGRHTIL